MYVSAEETGPQVPLRAERLRAAAMGVGLLAEKALEQILPSALQPKPDMLVIDSIQTN